MTKKLRIPKLAELPRPVLLVLSMLLPLSVGAISSAFTQDAMKQFYFFNKPPASPPGWLFPIAWTLLYLLMGLASYYIFQAEKENPHRKSALLFYFVQLGFNFFWTLIFFNTSQFLAAFIWILLLLMFEILTMIRFYRIDKRAGLLLIPLCLWTIFASYLNLGIYILSITPMALPR